MGPRPRPHTPPTDRRECVDVFTHTYAAVVHAVAHSGNEVYLYS